MVRKFIFVGILGLLLILGSVQGFVFVNNDGNDTPNFIKSHDELTIKVPAPEPIKVPAPEPIVMPAPEPIVMPAPEPPIEIHAEK